MENLKQTTAQISLWRKFGFYLSGVFVLLALLGLYINGINFGLDFTGGYLAEFNTSQQYTNKEMNQWLSQYLPGAFQVTSAEGGTFWSVMQPDNAASLKGKAWLENFAESAGISLVPLDAIYIGSQIGSELIDQGGLALLTALIVILVYISIRFEWRLATGAVLALFHDVLVVLGIFAWLKIPFDLTTLASVLAIIGYSLNDSIIVGDKIRELMKLQNGRLLNDIINNAIKATIVRTFITSGTTLATVVAIWLYAGVSLSGFAIALFIGDLVGTFSSIAIAATVPQFLGLTADYFQKAEEEVCPLP